MRKIQHFLLIFTLSIVTNSTFAYSSPIELSEISFKDSNTDWIEINLKQNTESTIELFDDSLITKIESDKIANNKFILIHFKSEAEKTENSNGILEIFTTKNGIVGTTEQLYIKIKDQIIDLVCWKNSNPTKSELDDIKELQPWTKNCLNSDNIPKNYSISKINNKWEITAHPTPGETNNIKNSSPKAIIDIQKGELQQEIPFSLNLDGSSSIDPDNDNLTYIWKYPDQTVEKANPPSYRFEKEGIFKISLTVTDSFGESDTAEITVTALSKEKTTKNIPISNGDLSSSIKINEIFPNPPGKDSGKEWIELYNNSDKKVNLSNWTISNKKIPNITIQPSSYKAITGISLKNSADTIILQDFQRTPVDKINYTQSQEGLSYGKTIIHSKNSEKSIWTWTKPTKNQKNKTFVKISGTITTPPSISEDFFFEISTPKEETAHITFDLEKFEFDFLKSLLKLNTKITILAENISPELILHDYYIKSSPPQQKPKNKKNSWQYFLAIPITILTLGLLYSTKGPNPSSQHKPPELHPLSSYYKQEQKNSDH